MKFFLNIFLLFLVQTFSAQTYTAKVVGVVDGDTVDILLQENVKQRVRLAHVDTPERNQPFGAKAKKFVSDFCFGKEVKVVKPTHKETKKDIKLRQAQVKAKLPDRYRGNGGEARGRRYADRIYNMRDELDLMADAGIVTDTVTIRDWFHFKFGKQFKTSDLNFPPPPDFDTVNHDVYAQIIRVFQRSIANGKGDWFKGRPIAIAGYNNSFS